MAQEYKFPIILNHFSLVHICSQYQKKLHRGRVWGHMQGAISNGFQMCKNQTQPAGIS